MRQSGSSMRSSLRLGLALLLAAGAGLAHAHGGHDAKADSNRPALNRCENEVEFRSHKGIGRRVCDLGNGRYKVRLDDGTERLTHGTDEAYPFDSNPVPQALASEAVAASAITCTNEKYRIQAIYLIPADAADESSTYLPLIRQSIQQANDKVAAEAAKFGVSMSLKVACDSNGQPNVRVVRSQYRLNDVDIQRVDSEMRSKGFYLAGQDNMIWWGGGNCGGGVAWGNGDARPGPENNVNEATGIAITWGKCPFEVSLHEETHSMGAVLDGAPNSTQNGHCIDDSDIMCYADGGPRAGQYRTNVCPSPNGSLDYYYDCNNNDYFNPNPPAGSFLANNWNIASCNNKMIVRSGCGGGATGATLPAGYYQVINRNSNKCLDVAGVSTANGAAITEWDCLNNQQNQQWQFIATDSGYYRIMARHSNKAIDVSGGGTANGMQLLQWDWLGGNNQQWKAFDVGSGYYKFIARHSNRAMDVPNCNTVNGTQLQQWDDLNNGCQSFRLVKVADTGGGGGSTVNIPGVVSADSFSGNRSFTVNVTAAGSYYFRINYSSTANSRLITTSFNNSSANTAVNTGTGTIQSIDFVNVGAGSKTLTLNVDPAVSVTRIEAVRR